MIGIVDAGGGLRGIYGSAVFDFCLDHNINFDYLIGVSAGSANVASFLGRQKGRNRTFYMEYSMRKEYMSPGNFIKHGSYLDLDYIYGTLSNSDGEYPLNFDMFSKAVAKVKIVAANALTGETKYFEKEDFKRDDYSVCKASSAIPMVCKPYVIDGVPYYDGGISDPVPIEKALRDGCKKVIVILTRPLDFKRIQKKDIWPARIVRRKFPKAAELILQRYKTYNDSVAKAIQYMKEGRALVLAPDDLCGVETLTKDKDKLQMLYEKGYNDARRILDFLKE
ncbi:MAG: patatin family protein [Clostridia bacterium]|nr:patatin family protein [Clostridia bacterium]